MTGPMRDSEKAISLEVNESPAGLEVAAKTA